LTNRFLQGEAVDSIAWLEKKESKSMLVVKPNYYLRLMLVPFTVSAFIIYKGLGFDSIMRFFVSKKQSLEIIPFKDAGKYFSIHPFKYFAGAAIAGITDVLRALNLLL